MTKDTTDLIDAIARRRAIVAALLKGCQKAIDAARIDMQGDDPIAAAWAAVRLEENARAAAELRERMAQS